MAIYNLTIDDLKTDTYQSHARNKLISEAFYLTKDIEKYGSGYIRVRRELEQYPTMFFSYREMGTGYLVELSYTEQKIKSDVAEKDGGLNGGLNDLLDFIHDNPGKRTIEIAETIGIPAKTIEKRLTKLKKENYIDFRGSKKTGGYWEVKRINN